MARNRASMREGPLAELFRATEAAQRQAQEHAGGRAGAAARAGCGGREPREGSEARKKAAPPATEEPQEQTVEHVPDFARSDREEPVPAATTAAPETAAPEARGRRTARAGHHAGAGSARASLRAAREPLPGAAPRAGAATRVRDPSRTRPPTSPSFASWASAAPG